MVQRKVFEHFYYLRYAHMANKIKTIAIMTAFSLVTLHPLLLLCLAQASICSSVLLLIYITWLKMLMCGGCTNCFTTVAL